MLKLQEQFCLELWDYWQDPEVELVFIDEASCSSWTKCGRCWIDSSKPFYLKLAPNRGKSVQVQGAISNRQREFKYGVT